ncbi:MAG: methylenetetrahydrofolate reductase [NAD(P)H] [bacterium]|nr:methylenetetrahydrofolate reductase [NAD(P)H] [bacterium]
MKLSESFHKGKAAISFEIFPPKKEADFRDIDSLLDQLAELNPKFISVTFGAGGTSTVGADGKIQNPTIEIAKKIKAHGIIPAVHLTCLNYTRQEIDAMLLAFQDAGIRNILALRGDRNPDIEPKHDFEHASDLVEYIASHGDFEISGACYPEVHPECLYMDEDLANLKRKVDAGATHLISQLFFDNDYFYEFERKARVAGITVPIEAGIMPVTSKKQIERMGSLCGASIPPKLRVILDKYEDDPKALTDAGIVYAMNQIVDLLAHDVDGVHLYVMNKPDVARRICDGIAHLRNAE